MGKGTDEENSDVPNPADDEQNNEEGDPTDNSTPVIDDSTDDGQKQSEENPDGADVTDPEESEEGLPEETEENTSDDTTSTVDSFDAEVMAIGEVPIEFTITVDDSEVEYTQLTDYVANLTNAEDGKIDDTDDVTFKVAPTDTELELATSNPVKATIDSENEKTLTADNDGVYTITDSHTATSKVTVTINLVTKTYTFKAPAADDTNGVTWQIKKDAVDAAYADSAILKKSDETVVLQATLATGKNPVKVTVGTDAKELTAANNTAEFTIALQAADYVTDAAGKTFTATYVASTDVTIAGKNNTDTGFTTTYAVKKGDGTYGEFQTVTANKVSAYEGDVIGFKFTAPANKTIKAVTYGTDTPVSVNPDGVYEYTVVAPATDANALKVELEAAKTITVKAATGAQIKSVSYSTDGGNTYKAAEKSGADWKISVPSDAASAANVKIKVVAEDHNQVTYIHKGTDHVTTGTCEGCVFKGPAAAEAVTDAITNDDTNIPAAGLELTAATEKITVSYEFTKAGLTSAKIFKADGTTEVTAETAEGANKGKYILDEGAIYYVSVSAEELEKVQKVEANGTALRHYAKGFQFTASADGTPTVAITAKAEVAQTITVQYADGVTVAGDDFAAEIQAESYKTSADAETGAVTTKQPIATEEPNTTYSVWENTPFTFTVTPKDSNYYKVTKVAAGSTEAAATPLTADANGKYKIEKAATTNIYVTVALNDTDAEKITFNDVDGNVKTVEADLAGGSTYKAVDTLGTAIPFKPATGKKVTFKVTPQDGYEVDTVKIGTADVEKTGTGAAAVYTVDFASTKTAVVDIKTKATALDVDKYVTFTVNENSGVELKVDDAVKPIEKDGKPTTTYKLTKAVAAAGTTAAVAEISELKFDVIVPYGSYLADKSFVITGVRATAEKRTLKDGAWIYSYKVVANQISGTEASPTEIEIAAYSATEETVTIKTKKAGQTASYKNLDTGRSDTLDNTGVQAAPGTSFVVTLNAGDTATLNGDPVELDDYHTFAFDAELDDEKENASVMEIDITAAETTHTLKYTKNLAEPYKEVPEDGISANISDKVYVKLFDKAGSTPVAISKYDKKEGADATTVTLSDQTAKTGEAVIDVRNEDITIDFYYEDVDDSGSYTKVTEKVAATLKIKATDASQVTLTAKGIAKNRTLTLDATSRTSYPLTIKRGRTTENAAAYDNLLKVTYGENNAATSTDVYAFIDDGVLYIDTLKGGDVETDVKITAVGQAADAALLTFKVKGKTPALKVKSVDSPNQGVNEILVNATADGSIKPVSSQFKYYYEINVAAKEGVTNKGVDKLGYYYVAAQADEKGKLQPLSQLVKVNTASTEAQTPNSYTISVKLVAKYNAVLPALGTPLTGDALSAPATVDFASTAAAAKDIDTRAMRFENKLGVTKKTTKFYSGQTGVVVAIPKFSKDAGWINGIEAVVYNKDGSLADTDVVWADEVDLNTMEVSVGTSAYAAGTYDVVIYATAAWNDTLKNGAGDFDMYRASAKVPITVQKGINEIEVDPVDEILIKDYGTPKAKDASFTLKPVGYYYYDSQGSSRNVKAQTQKFEYKVNTFGNDKNEDKVVVKGNKITIKKDFYISNDPLKNVFDVDILPTDYGTTDENYENDRMTYITVTVTKNALELGGIKLKRGSKTYAAGSTISSHDLDGATVIVTDKAGKEISPRLVDFTPNKGGVYVSKNNEYDTAYVIVSKYAKTLTIKATTRDGGKKNVSAKFNVGYISGANFVLTHYDEDSDSRVERPEVSTGAALTKIGDRNWTFKGSNDDKIEFTIMNKVVDEEGDAHYDQALKDYYNYTVKITGGKNTSKTNEAYGNYSIAPNKDGKVVVSITDKTAPKGTKPVEFTITNTGWSKDAAPSASTKDKLYYAKTPTSETVSTEIAQDLTYTVKNNKNNYNAVRWTYVSGSGIKRNSSYGDYLSGVYDIDAKGQFTVPNIKTTGTGTEKYSLIYGKKNAEGVFTPMTKAATVSVKVNKVGNIKAAAKYTISTNIGYRVKLEAKPSISFKNNQKLVDYVGVLSANIKGADKKFGQRNQFFDYFEVKDGYLQVISTKRADTELAKLTKDDLTGYLVYRYVNDKGNVVTKQDKITVVINETGAPKYAATPINVVAAANVTAKTTIMLGGEKVAIAAGKVKAAEGSGWTATCTGEEAADGIVTMTAQTPANKNVDLYLIPADSKYAAAADSDPVTNGIKVTVAVKTVGAEDAKSKVSLSKTAKVPTAEIVGNNSVELTATYELGKDFSLLWSNADIVSVAKLTADEEAALTKTDEKTGAAAVKTVSTWNTEGKSFSITFDRTDLPTTNGKKVYKVPVKLTFTQGEPEIVAFSVQPEMVPKMGEVETLIKDALVDKTLQGCLVSNPNDAATAVSEVTAALAKVEIPKLAGITAGGVAVKDADKFADNPSATPAVTGDHLIKITLTDVTLADAEGKTKDIEIKVVKKPDLAEEIKAAIDKWRVPGDDDKVPEGKTKITLTSPTEYDVRNAIQTAVDKVYGENLYIVAVHDFEITHVTVTTPSTGNSVKVNAEATTEKVTGMTFSYTVKNAATGADLEEDAAPYEVIAGKGSAEGTIETPDVQPSQPVVPETPGATSVAIAAAGGAATITQNAADALEFTAAVSTSKGDTVTTVADLAALKNAPTLEWTLEKKGASDSDYTVVTTLEGVTFTKDATELKATLKVTNAIDAGTSFKVTATVTGIDTPADKVVTVKAADPDEA